MNIALENHTKFGIRMVCDALDISESTFYRKKAQLDKDLTSPPTKPPRRHHRSMSEEEKKEVLAILNSKRFMDMAPEEIYATLLDEGKYICSARSMYRILKVNKAVRERRNQLRHPNYEKPELLATKPNQLWSWDITKLKTDQKWTYHYLYVILDVYSRYVVGWLVAPRESQDLAKKLINETCQKQGIQPDQLTIHADRGASMRSKAVSQLMADLGVCRSHSRPHVSNDNPYSESQFKTLKYHYTFPEKFASLEDTKLFLRKWFNWYNKEHRHSGIGMMTPENMHTGEAFTFLEERRKVMKQAYEKHPERFVKGCPKIPDLPTEVWINKPQEKIDNKIIKIKIA